MRDGPSAQVLSGAYRWRPQIASWKGTDLLADQVPVEGGEITADATAEIPEGLTFSVPEWAAGRSWIPNSPQHPLAEYGQYLDVDIQVWSSLTAAPADSAPTSTSSLGRFRIQNWEHDEISGTVKVSCVGVLQRPKESGFRTPLVPRPGATFSSEIRRLMVPGMPVQIDAGLVDRAVPRSMVWGEDRLKALYELADAWPARLRVDQFGVVRYLLPLPSTPVPVLSWRDGEGGTVVGAPTMGTREGIANVVIARSSATDDPGKTPLAVVVSVQDGPLQPDTFNEVTFNWSSPLATTEAQLRAAAQTMLERKSRPARVRRVKAAPDPRVELDDPAEVTTEDGGTDVGYVVGYRLPLTHQDGAMTVDVGVQ